jgi:hypothetical protein
LGLANCKRHEATHRRLRLSCCHRTKRRPPTLRDSDGPAPGVLLLLAAAAAGLGRRAPALAFGASTARTRAPPEDEGCPVDGEEVKSLPSAPPSPKQPLSWP